MVTLWPWQAEAATRIKSGEIQALFWSPRVGKTLAAIAGTDSGDRLIVCPNSVKSVWRNDLQLWGQDSYIYDTNKKPKERPRNVICNYEKLWRTNLLSLNWDSIVFDESHRLSNPRSKLWEHVYSHIRDLCRSKVLLLTGTPCVEGYFQMITQSCAATGQCLGYTDPWQCLRESFTYDDYFHKWKVNQGWEAKFKAQLQQLGPSLTIAETGFTVSKVYRRMPIPAGPHELALWKVTKARKLEGAQLCLAAQSCASGRDPVTGETASSSKLNAIADWIRDAGRPCVILTRFTASLHYLASRLQGMTVGLIHGQDDGSEARGRVIEAFNAGDISVIIANVQTVKVGLNLSKADTSIFAENSFSGETRIQAEDRATALGKSLSEILDFVTEGDDLLGEIDDGIRNAVSRKLDFNTSTMKG